MKSGSRMLRIGAGEVGGEAERQWDTSGHDGVLGEQPALSTSDFQRGN